MSNRSTQIFIAILAVMTLLLGYNYYARPFLRRYQQERVKNQEEKEAQQAKADYLEEKLGIIEQLSAEQKIAQLIAYPYLILDLDYSDLVKTDAANAADKLKSDTDPLLLEAEAQVEDNSELTQKTGVSLDELLLTEISTLEPGFITIFGKEISFDQAQQHISVIRDIFLDKPSQPLFAVDHEGGDVQRLSGEGFTQLPSWRETCKLGEEEQRLLFQSSAAELSQLGVNIVFAPVLDFNSQVLGSRSCQEFAALHSTTRGFIAAFGNERIMPVVKHFPGLGQTKKDLHKSSDIINLTAEDTKIFSQIMVVFPNIGVMSSHVQLQDKLNGLPCSLSEECLSVFTNDMPLRLVFTDALEMGALNQIGEKLALDNNFVQLIGNDDKTTTSLRLAALSYQAILAGNDVLVFGPDVGIDELLVVKNELAVRYNEEESFRQRVDQSLAKIIALKK